MSRNLLPHRYVHSYLNTSLKGLLGTADIVAVSEILQFHFLGKIGKSVFVRTTAFAVNFFSISLQSLEQAYLRL